MTPAETARHFLMDGNGDAICEACLALACATSLLEMRSIATELLKNPSFHRRDGCAGCRRTIPAIAYVPKCTRCSQAVLAGDKITAIGAELFHDVCLRMQRTEQTIRESRALTRQSRRLLDDMPRPGEETQ